MTRVHTRHKTAAGWCANGAGGVKIGELHTLVCHTIDTWSLEVFLAEAGEVAVAGVIHHDVDEVRFTGNGMGKSKSGGTQESQDVNVLHGLDLFWVKVKRNRDNRQKREVTQKVHLPGKDSM
jgi:hypothetical protein